MGKQKHSPNPKTRRCWTCICGLFNVPEAIECKGILMDLISRPSRRTIERRKIDKPIKNELELKHQQAKRIRELVLESLVAKVKPKGE